MGHHKGLSPADAVIEYFTALITEGKQASARRQLTIETINRYIFCLNQVMAQGHISLVDLRNDIKNILEKGKGFEIDKKTLKRIIDRLLRDHLIKTLNFKVTVQQAEGLGVQTIVKTLVLDPDCDENADELMLNPSISNPTNRQPVKEETPVQTRYSLRRRGSKPAYEQESIVMSESGEEDEEEVDL